MSLRSQAGKSPMCLRPRPVVCAGVMGLFCSIQLLAQGLQVSTAGASPTAAGSFTYPTSIVSQTGAGAGTSASPATLSALVSALRGITNPPVPLPASPEEQAANPLTNALVANLISFFSATNGLPPYGMSQEELVVHQTQRLEMARYLRTTRQPREAEPILTELLGNTAPELMQQGALLELAALAQDENNLSRAQEIYAQFLNKWPDDLRVPEILLRQGMLFRQMGLYNLAFTKFYGVMTSALVLKNDQLDYYIRLVLQAQTEIAETQYELGKYADAAESFRRLLKQNPADMDKTEVIYRLVRCYTTEGHYLEAISEAQDFLARYPDAPEQPEIRFHLALALKEAGRNTESLQQVLLLLQEQRARTKDRPEVWAYWQQRAGNVIANQLYREGDYAKALEIYRSLAQLDPAPLWQLPVAYQIGMTYERLWQPQKATETYSGILAHETELGTNTPPNLKTVFEMARWRIQFIQWQGKAEAANHRLRLTAPTNNAFAASLSQAPVVMP